MKTLAYIGCGLVLLTGSLTAHAAKTTTPATSTTPTKQHHPDFLAQLNLTDAQKAQIKQIKAGNDPKKQQKQEIKALLTEAQKTQLKQLHKSWKAQQSQTATT